MKKIRVFGKVEVTVSTVIEVGDDEELYEDDIFEKADEQFGGVHPYAGNGGLDKVIGVSGQGERIEVEEWPVFDRYEEEDV